jgi:hypothetical protein
MILVYSKWLIVKLVAPKGHNDRPDEVILWIGLISHHLGSFLGVIELIILCAFVCRVRYFDAQIRETLLYKHGV